MKIFMLIMLGAFIISCASDHVPDRDVASNPEEEQTKKEKNKDNFVPRRGMYDYR